MYRSASTAKVFAAMKFWIVGITAVLSLVALGPL